MSRCDGHGFTRPVSRVLLHSGKCIEKGAFSYIGISGQGDSLFLCRSIPRSGEDPGGLPSCRISGKSHIDVSFLVSLALSLRRVLSLNLYLFPVGGADGDNGTAD